VVTLHSLCTDIERESARDAVVVVVVASHVACVSSADNVLRPIATRRPAQFNNSKFLASSSSAKADVMYNE